MLRAPGRALAGKGPGDSRGATRGGRPFGLSPPLVCGLQGGEHLRQRRVARGVSGPDALDSGSVVGRKRQVPGRARNTGRGIVGGDGCVASTAGGHAALNTGGVLDGLCRVSERARNAGGGNTGKGEDAGQLLGAIYGRFAEGFDTPDLTEARAFLEDLP
ncbi:MAG: hypothetical protein PVI59_13530 [Anaerolineae bacterium]